MPGTDLYQDEYVTVKSPSQNILVENVYCNWSGGCAMGSLSQDTDISNITYRHIYTYKSNQEYMVWKHDSQFYDFILTFDRSRAMVEAAVCRTYYLRTSSDILMPIHLT